ncbi:hypothetical protein PRZ48_012867 [Zasmidium cellare]|uniref:Uncharacterized protein n=1 Tax=Zasmidium cellare TaxID=395010 RepID=A0ABR0E2P0_ZASCE|nr:hypothetical protein PRZ48_012867 [Zasmidium cellare]
MKAPSMALLRAFAPITHSQTLPWTARGCLAQQQKSNFSTTEQRQARDKNRGPKKDPRITQIRYHLYHPLTPRPLRFSRNRALRHWTIHRAWQRYLDEQRKQTERTLERQYNAMSAACEALRLVDAHGLTADERTKIGESNTKEEGRLYRIAMLKTGVWDKVPIEYGRIQTETPPRKGWNHEWTR